MEALKVLVTCFHTNHAFPFLANEVASGDSGKRLCRPLELETISRVERENREQRAERHLSRERERETERYVVGASRGR